MSKTWKIFTKYFSTTHCRQLEERERERESVCVCVRETLPMLIKLEARVKIIDVKM